MRARLTQPQPFASMRLPLHSQRFELRNVRKAFEFCLKQGPAVVRIQNGSNGHTIDYKTFLRWPRRKLTAYVHSHLYTTFPGDAKQARIGWSEIRFESVL